jgi:chromosome segregation ATPase
MSKTQMAELNANNAQMQLQRMDSLSTEHATLEADFQAASAKLDQLVTQNAQMDSMLKGDKEALSKLRGQIRSILKKKDATQAELEQARIMIASLNDKTREYEARIAELEKENTILTGNNKVLTRERDSTVTQNIAIKQLASVLHASNIRMEAIKVKRNGKEKETQRAKKADILRITFDIDENRIAESGTKMVYLRVVDPKGAVINNPAKGSGMITTAKGDHLSYTLSKAIPLVTNQPYKNVIVDWNQDGEYEKGSYKIEIYNDGYSIGYGEVQLK